MRHKNPPLPKIMEINDETRKTLHITNREEKEDKNLEKEIYLTLCEAKRKSVRKLTQFLEC